MKSKGCKEEQIITILKGHEVGVPVVQLARRLSIVQATCYRWKYTYAGLAPSDVRRLWLPERKTSASNDW
jgi:hypothetical protein